GLEAALGRLRDSRSRPTLVVGAGWDPYSGLFEARASGRYTRLDLERHGDVTDVVADGLQLPFPAGSWGRVLAIEVLEHVADPASFIQELGRVLQVDGDLLVTVPFLFPVHGSPEFDFRRLTVEGLKALAPSDLI